MSFHKQTRQSQNAPVKLSLNDVVTIKSNDSVA